MSDDEIMALANAVSEKMRLLADIRAAFATDQETYTARYAEWDLQRAKVADAERALDEANAALDAGLATR